MNIRLARVEDIESLNQLFKDVICDMKNKNNYMWNDVYPFCEFENDISNNRMYLIEDESVIIGSFVLNDLEDSDFECIDWNLKSINWISINRLAILPQKQGKGYAKKAMAFIENIAKEKGYDVIRLTVYENNKNAIRLYEKFGFKKVQKGSYSINNMIFIGYEKSI